MNRGKQVRSDGINCFVSKPERLQKILSAHGVASRREAEKMILEGRVRINGVPATLGQSAELGLDEISVDDLPLAAADEPVYIMLNKPRGYVTTSSDEQGRKTVMSLVQDVGIRVFPIGRLDMNSGGLLLLTNDGEFANIVAHPSYNKFKTYEVKVRGDAQRAALLMRKPIEIDNHTVQAKKVELSKVTEVGGVLKITVSEGRNRQIRKMCAACGVSVQTLKRISIGTLKLGSLKPGLWRHLTEEEVQSLR